MEQFFTPEIVTYLKTNAADASLRILYASIIFFAGSWLAKFLSSLIATMLGSTDAIDDTISSFVKNVIYYAIMALVLIASLGQMGVQTASFVAILGSAGIAVGLALQGSLSNFAAGILLILFRPIKAGDYIEGGGTAGSVEEINIFTTHLATYDGKSVVVPNSKLSADVIVNYSKLENRRVDITIGVSYEASTDEVKTLLHSVLDKEQRILTTPAADVAVSKLGSSSVDFMVMVWVQRADYFKVLFALNEAIKKAFEEHNIKIAYPQTDVHLYRYDTSQS